MKPNWSRLLDERSLAALLPREHAHFARPVCDALAVFLGGLPAADQGAVLRAQTALPLTTSFSERLGVLARSSPVLQKLGQVVARDRRLAPELQSQLRELESLPPTTSLETIQGLLRDELGPLDRRGITLLPPAVAEASVAVVIPFRQAGRDAEGVFKVLKPQIEERLERELAVLERVGEYLDQRVVELGIPSLDYEEAFQQVRDKLRDEVRLDNEQQHLRQARVEYSNEPRVLIPELWDSCTSRVTAMERITGGKVTGDGTDGNVDRRGRAALVAKALIAMPVFSRKAQALFHGDPHAGNLFVTDEGRLAILDWSLVGRLGEQERVAVTQLILGGLTLDADHILAVLEQLADRRRLDVAALGQVVEASLRCVRRGRLPGLSWLIGMLDEATQRARLRVSADLMLFRKSLHTLEGVIADIGGSSGLIDWALCTEFLRHLVAEWPLRWLRPPDSRDYATRLSNLDLTRTFLSGPTTTARFWSGQASDVLQACERRCRPAFSTAAGRELLCP